MDKPMPVISCVPASSIEQRPIDDFASVLPRNNTLKREWGEIDDFGSSPRDRENSEQHLTKKCKNCEIMDFRLQYNKEKMENMIQSSEEIHKKMGLLNKKSNKLSLVLLTLMKPANNIKTGLTSNAGNEKEKTILEQLNTIINTNNRVTSVVNDDSVKVINNIFGGNINMSNLMAKLLCGTGDQALSPDTSRET